MKNELLIVAKSHVTVAVSVASIVTYFMLLSASGGWSGLFIILYGAVFYILVALTFLIVSASKKHTHTQVSKYLLYSVFFSFFLIVLLTPADCGDSPGSYTFLFYVFNQIFSNGAYLCEPSVVSTVLYSLVVPAYIFHLSLLATLLVKQFKETSESNARAVGNRFVFKLMMVWTVMTLCTVLVPRGLIMVYEAQQAEELTKQAEAARVVASYPFSIIPTEPICVSTMSTTVTQAIQAGNEAVLAKVPGGYWELRYAHPFYYAENYKPVQESTCSWIINVYQPWSKLAGSYESLGVLYIVDGATHKVREIKGGGSISNGPAYNIFLPLTQ